MAKKVTVQECEAAGRAASAARKLRRMHADAQLICSFFSPPALYSLGCVFAPRLP